MPRIPIRLKLAASLAVPLFALVTLSFVEVRQTADEVARTRSQTELAKASTGPTGLITRVQDERSWAAVELIGTEATVTVPTQGYEESRRETDETLTAFREEIRGKGGAIEATYGPVVARLDELEAIRREIDGNTAPHDLQNMGFATTIYDRYSELIHGLLDANTRVSLQVDDTDLRQGTELADIASHQIEVVADLSRQTIVTAASPTGIDTPAEITALSTLLADFDRHNQAVQAATGPYSAVVAETFPRDLSIRLSENVEAAINSGTLDDLNGFLADLNVPVDEGFTGFRDAVVETVNSRADTLNREAVTQQRWFIALAVAALAVAGLMTWLVSRSITRPLRSLTRQAKAMAEHRLPEAVLDILETPLGDDVRVPQIEPVTVRTRDEVADVTAALNTVQESALDLAVEQAVLRRNIADSFVNLGRRNQNLLGRQLDFITELESNETNPDTLASLFRLDHLATRMRRNAESLLVLAGIEPPRKWAAPVRIADVIRAALGEVEDYQRVTVDIVEAATIVGSTAADLAHLVAELLENALTFSSPDDDVVVRGWWAERDGYRLAVIDAGFGMTPPAITQANRRLAGSESFTVAPSKYLGHYVAGNLAARHGIYIQLDPASPRGVIATVDLPAHLLTNETPTGDPVSDPHGIRPVPGSAAGVPGPGGAGVAPPAVAPGPPPTVPGPMAAPAAASRPQAATPAPPMTATATEAPPAATAAPPPAPMTAPMRSSSAPAAPEPRRTASGLPKRAASAPAVPPREYPGPSREVLAALGDYARSRGHERGTGATWGPAMASAGVAARAPSGPRWEASPAPPDAPPGGTGGGGRPAPAPAPALRAAAAAPTHRRPTTAPGGPRPDPRSGGTTSGGLARRVSGAQLPSTEPLSLRRNDHHAPAEETPRPDGTPPAHDVYAFLSGFTAGVQRGLDEARNDDG